MDFKKLNIITGWLVFLVAALDLYQHHRAHGELLGLR
jgi:hypothetical protein